MPGVQHDGRPVGQVYFAWTAPRPGVFSDRSALATTLGLLFLWLMFVVLFVLWFRVMNEGEMTVLSNLAAVGAGTYFFALLTGFAWVADFLASKCEGKRITFDSAGFFGLYEGKPFEFHYDALVGFDIAEVWATPRRLGRSLYLFPVGSRTCFEFGDDGAVIFEDRSYEGVLDFLISDKIDVESLRAFLSEYAVDLSRLSAES